MGVPKRLTEMQQRFAQLLVSNEGRKTPTECAIEAGYEKDRARITASELQNAKKYPLVSETNTQQDIEMPFCSDGSLGIDLTTTLRIIRVHRADADQITLRAGHRILKVNGTDVSNRKDMIQEVKSHLKEHTKDVPLQLFVEDEGLAL